MLLYRSRKGLSILRAELPYWQKFVIPLQWQHLGSNPVKSLAQAPMITISNWQQSLKCNFSGSRILPPFSKHVTLRNQPYDSLNKGDLLSKYISLVKFDIYIVICWYTFYLNSHNLYLSQTSETSFHTMLIYKDISKTHPKQLVILHIIIWQIWLVLKYIYT